MNVRPRITRGIGATLAWSAPAAILVVLGLPPGCAYGGLEGLGGGSAAEVGTASAALDGTSYHDLEGCNPFGNSCKVCHTFEPSLTVKACLDCHSSGTKPIPASHNPASRCLDCHKHELGFRPSCGSCHEFPPSSGSHDAHMEYFSARMASTDACKLCHDPFGPNHNNGHADVTFVGAGALAGGSYNEATKQCNNTYCHSDGTAVSTGTIANTNSARVQPVWGGSLGNGCASCHRGPQGNNEYPNYLQDAPKSNTHKRHSEKAAGTGGMGYTCEICHSPVMADGVTISDTTKHINGVYDVAAAPKFVTSPPVAVAFGFQNDPGGGKCSTISCHGANPTETWGGVHPFAGVGCQPAPLQYGCYLVNCTAASQGGGTAPYSFVFDFGDGTTIANTTGTASHQFSSAGAKTVKAEVRDKFQHPAYATTNVNAYGSNVFPTAAFSVARTAALTVTLTDLSYDTDYNACGQTGSGKISINWGVGAIQTLTLPLTNQPSNVKFTRVYSAPITAAISIQVKDNTGKVSPWTPVKSVVVQ